MKNFIFLISIILLVGGKFTSTAQDSISISGDITPRVNKIEIDNNSSKFNEYRDLRDGFYIQDFSLDVLNYKNGWFMDLKGNNVVRKDQNVYLKFGNLKKNWNIEINNNQTPHSINNNAKTPFIDLGDGLFKVPYLSGITKDGDNATGTPSLVPTTSQMMINDDIIAKYLGTALYPVNLATQRDRTTLALNLPDLGALKFGVDFMFETRQGLGNSYGPIGDRPPRTLNVQIMEPIKYNTNEVNLKSSYSVKLLQLNFDYLFSNFNNRIENMVWQNMFFSPDAGKDYIAAVAGTERNVSSYAQRSLAPDNFAHNFTFSGGIDLPLNSRFNTIAVLGIMKQNQELLPYSYSNLGGDVSATNGDGKNWNDLSKLPRKTAEAEMQTMRLDMEYTINPVNRLNVRAYMRYYKLDNNTPSAQWRYVTQDVAGTTGDVAYINRRINLAYAYDKQKYGLDLRHYMVFWNTSLELQVARENIHRKFREGDTGENMLELEMRTKPVNRLSLSASYLAGNRTGDSYNYMATSQSYWYTFEQGANQVDNPQFLFANHPDLRKYDLSDRIRHEFKFDVLYFADNFDISATYRRRSNNFDSDVVSIAPLANTTVPIPNPADKNEMTPGQQLGLLKDVRDIFGINTQFTPGEKLTFSLFYENEIANYDNRGLVYNENRRNEPSNPSIQAPTQLGPWTDANRLYNNSTNEKVNTIGAGFIYDIIPGKLKFNTDMNFSLAKINMDYSGYGSDPAFLGVSWETFQFGFNDPDEVKYSQYVINASFEYSILYNLILGVHYCFDQYIVQDWVQAPSGPWVEQVQTENYVRDTSRDNRWGNRIVSFGGYPAPSYKAHIGFLTLAYRF